MVGCQTHESLVILIHEIHGVNDHMHDITKRIRNLGVDVLCPNLYPSGTPEGESEEDHYKSYFQHIGIKKAKNTVIELVDENRKNYRNIYVIGFSVGATVAWLCSEHQYISGVICYYGSRIRDYVHINPTCPTHLFFSDVEKSFDVRHLSKEIEQKENDYISLHLFHAFHGFANPYSQTFCQNAFHQSFALLENVLNGQKMQK
ncbi:hypothetical protein KH172YL63_22620 [Bacillus sp. KH172YL63]|nr:hypothetical protein KH172YL63_22620 [Bacillus sp. KH172YL63]